MELFNNYDDLAALKAPGSSPMISQTGHAGSFGLAIRLASRALVRHHSFLWMLEDVTS